jgi:hypothetical protein
VDVDESKKLQMVFKFGNYGQRNNFLFKENDQVTTGLGDSYFTINDTTLPDEIDAVQLNHSATEQTPKFNGKIIPEIEAIETDLNKWQNPGWRLLQLETQPTSYSVTYRDDSNAVPENTNIPFARFVGFNETLPEFYDALTGILENTKGVPMVFKLSPDLIHNLDHTIPLRLAVSELDISGYFYVNVVHRYQGGNTLVDLVRL